MAGVSRKKRGRPSKGEWVDRANVSLTQKQRETLDAWKAHRELEESTDAIRDMIDWVSEHDWGDA